MASQSCESAATALAPAGCDAAALATPDVAGAVVLPAVEPVDKDPKSKLLSVPKWALLAESLLAAWLGGGLLSKTGLKSSRPEREMLAKSSSAEPSFASSRPSKSSSRSSNALVAAERGAACDGAAGWWAALVPKMSSA